MQLDKTKDELKKMVKEYFILDRDIHTKTWWHLVDALEADGYNVYFREIKYGLADDEYM